MIERSTDAIIVPAADHHAAFCGAKVNTEMPLRRDMISQITSMTSRDAPPPTADVVTQAEIRRTTGKSIRTVMKQEQLVEFLKGHNTDNDCIC